MNATAIKKAAEDLERSAGYIKSLHKLTQKATATGNGETTYTLLYALMAIATYDTPIFQEMLMPRDLLVNLLVEADKRSDKARAAMEKKLKDLFNEAEFVDSMDK